MSDLGKSLVWVGVMTIWGAFLACLILVLGAALWTMGYLLTHGWVALACCTPVFLLWLRGKDA